MLAYMTVCKRYSAVAGAALSSKTSQVVHPENFGKASDAARRLGRRAAME